MGTVRVSVRVPEEWLRLVRRLAGEAGFPNLSCLVRAAVDDLLRRCELALQLLSESDIRPSHNCVTDASRGGDRGGVAAD